MVSLPVSLINPSTLVRETLIDLNSVRIKSIYNGQQIDVKWSQNNSAIDLHSGDSLQSSQNDSKYLPTTLSSNEENPVNGLLGDRNRRSIEYMQKAYFNPYLQKVIATNQSDITSLPYTMNNFPFERESFSVNDRILSYLPSNRTIHLNCTNSNEYCLVGRFRVSNFKASNSPVLITLNFTIDMTKIGRIMSGKKDILVIRTTADLEETFHSDS